MTFRLLALACATLLGVLVLSGRTTRPIDAYETEGGLFV